MLATVLTQIDAALAGRVQSITCVLRSPDDPGVLLPDNMTLPLFPLVLSDEQADNGMGFSLAAASKACCDADAIMVFLADMPAIRPQTMQAVYDALDVQRISVPVCQGRRGHPVGFGRDFFSELQQLRADKGAKSLLSAYHQDVSEVVVHDSGVLLDIDTVAEWHDFNRNK